MSEDPTRATAIPSDLPTHGRVGPADPHADPATDPNMRPVRFDDAEGPTVPTKADRHKRERAAPDHEDDDRPVVENDTTQELEREQPKEPPAVTRSRTGGLWTGLILSALVLLLLLIFILQNSAPMQITFLAFTGSLPTGVALLFAAIAGLLLVAIPGGLRMMQLRRAARRGSRH
ncbi:LapA family protein [Pseudonocardia sp. TRM90224]|uniref:LapA family protein n=1 Tax=Pseudonocardia sp. TRM90224 TaxID=2812678 RepID=UPI001E54C40D|nr:lipopolysaccharide assembly protein LapA domain-containing protein [Pseudonocardia sp. TRM90224]